MKKIVPLFTLACVVLLLSSCLTTLHPIFTLEDIVYKPELAGSWKTLENKKVGRALFSPLANEPAVELPGKISEIKNKGYLVTYFDEEGAVESRYIAFLAKIGKHLYFDYYPAAMKGDKQLDEFYTYHFNKMHTPYRVEMLKNGSFQLSQLESGRLEKLIEQKKIRIRHEVTGDGKVIITASTAELQQYIVKYGDDPETYRSDKTLFTKQIIL